MEKERMKKPLIMLLLSVYLAVSLIVPNTFKGEAIFYVDSALWALALVLTVLVSRREQVDIWGTDRVILKIALAIAIFQVFLLVFASLFMGFGRNTNVWTPQTLAVYFPYLLTPFLAIELSRAFLAKSVDKRKPTLALVLLSLFCTLVGTSASNYASLTTAFAVSEFLIRTFLPGIAVNLLATYIAFTGGFPASLGYMAIPTILAWFSPILPNPPWTTQSMIITAAAITGFIVLEQTAVPSSARRHDKVLGKSNKPQYWIVTILIGLIAVWSSIGLLGFTPTIVASGSMKPTLNQGDMVIIISTPPPTIKIGDIIQYRASDMIVIHRVIDKYEASGILWFITKGDSNNAPDDPISANQVIGRAVLTIPQLGWVSVVLKETIMNAYTFLVTTLPPKLASICTTTNCIYAIAALFVPSYGCLLLTYKNRKRENSK
jgi:signal peptidase